MSPRPAILLTVSGLLLLVLSAAQGQAPPAPVKDPDIQKLIDLLGADRFAVREKASKQLAAMGRTAVPSLQQATTHVDAEIRTRAERVLVAIQNSVAFLVESLKDGDVQVRRQAAAGLERLGPPARSAVASLIEALRDEDEGVRDAAISALLTIEPQHKAVADVVPVKAHADGKYRRLLRRIRMPEDQRIYSDAREFGFYPACDWAGHTSIPAGYWVYVFPYWYVWGECK